MQLLIDVIGTCNLKCPSCPVGNSPQVKNAKGVLGVDKLHAILEKAMRECTVDTVALFNWTDPIINPNLPQLVRTVKSFGLHCQLSSNLNLLENEDALLSAEPDTFRVSMSGFTQANYGINHRGGDVSTVLKNVERLAAAKVRTGSRTSIDILYHRYLGNLDDESKLRQFAAQHGVTFDTCWAYFMPLEKVLAFAYNDPQYSPMNDEDRQVLSRLALPFDEAISIAERHRSQPCSLLEDQIVIDVKGDVVLCCTISDQSKYKIGNFLERPLSEIISDKHELKKCKDLCATCTKKGLHVYATYGTPEFDKAATKNVLRHYEEALKATRKPALSLLRRRLIDSLKRRAPRLLKAAKEIKSHFRSP